MSNGMPKAGTFCWNELTTKDAKASKSFFTQLLGWDTKESEFDDMKYTEFQVDGKSVAGMLQMTEEWGDAPSHWMGYITVVDVDGVAAKVESLGGKVCVPPTDIPNIGRFAVINDPAGATVSLITLASR
ncbi:MAG: VOC family protein [candidate division Zixibacteria bacterium]|nr:VOC family protein [candidate division Zixibacteria bacterium]MBU1470832.1 VOC family protein [candidate division Zixibacteria bacterium]MBU2625748.1 VOC family protein [candidate division Zixibacteria bacterium]